MGKTMTSENKFGLWNFVRDPLAGQRKRKRKNIDAHKFLDVPVDVKPDLDLAMVKRVVFYNHYHNGDIHCARGIVAEIIREFPKISYTYSHGCPVDLLQDMETVRHAPALLARLPKHEKYLIDHAQKTVYINTWIGCLGAGILGEYRGINITLLHRLISASIKRAMGMDPPRLQKCVPDPNFSKFSIDGINDFIRRDSRQKVMISNGKILSGQSAEFDFSPLIQSVARYYPDVLFIPTNPTDVHVSNVIHSADIIKKNGPDLNENGYLSTFCDVIIGRSSGTYSYAINRTNLRSRKVFLGFVNLPVEASLGFDEPVFEPRCEFIATNDFREHFMLRRIVETVGKWTQLGSASNPHFHKTENT